MTIGDVLAAIGAAVLVISSWIALLLLAAFLLPRQVDAARERIEAAPWRCGVVGAVTTLCIVIVAAIVARGLISGARLLPMLIGGLMLLGVAVGSAGIVQIIARRTAGSAPWTEPRLSQMARAATLYVLAGLFPFCGWMVITPAALFVSLGASLPISAPRRATRAASNPPQVEMAPTAGAPAA